MAVLQVKGMKGEEHTCRGGKAEMASGSSVGMAPLGPSAKAPLPETTPVSIPRPPVTAAQPRRESTLTSTGTFVLEMKQMKKVKRGYGTRPGTENAAEVFDCSAFVGQEQNKAGSLEGQTSSRKDRARQLRGVFYFKSVDL